MKVVIIGPAHPLRGGIADFNEALASAFQDEGSEVSIFSFSYQYPSFLFPGTSQFTKDAAPKQLSIQSTIHSLNPLSWRRTASQILKTKPDLVLVRYWLPFMAPALGSICRLLRRKAVKVIAITDNVIPHEKRPGDKQLTNYFLRSCKGFIAMSKSVMEDVRSFIPNASAVFLPHPIYNIFGDIVDKEVARKKLDINEKDKVILFFGFIRAYKGLDLLLDAMADERLASMKVKLIIAGEFYEDKKPYLDQIDRLSIQDRVIFHSSYIPKEDVKYYFCTCDMVVQPYRSATQSGITQIAYHFEKPMLVTNVGGLPEIVPDQHVGYVTEISGQSIANRIFDFYNLQKDKEFSMNIKTEKERFTWSAFIRGVKKLYEDIL